MEDYLHIRLLLWFSLVFAIAYLFLIVDLSIRLSYRVDTLSLKRIVQLLKNIFGLKKA
jgi:hypothetical protein